MKSERALVLLRADTAGLPDTEAQEMTRNRRSLASPPEIEVNSPLVSLLTRGVRALLVFSLSFSLRPYICAARRSKAHRARALPGRFFDNCRDCTHRSRRSFCSAPAKKNSRAGWKEVKNYRKQFRSTLTKARRRPRAFFGHAAQKRLFWTK